MMTTSTETTINGFTESEIADVTRKTATGLGIEYDKPTEDQKQAYIAAAKGALTGERPKGFTSHLVEGFRPADKRTPGENAAFADETAKAEATETEFWKFARDEFDRRRA
jgi:hypothetical protein